MNFELLEHPADVGFRAYGRSLEDLFANCAHALTSIYLDPTRAIDIEEWDVEAEGSDVESLLVNWLNEVLYYLETKGIVFRSLHVAFPSPLRVRCKATGECRDREKHPVRVQIKAVTYHQLKISRLQDGWMAEVYVDV